MVAINVVYQLLQCFKELEHGIPLAVELGH